MYGLGGSGVIIGGPGKDLVDGGAGNDQLVAVDGQRDIVDCGRGHDKATVDRSETIRNCEAVTRSS